MTCCCFTFRGEAMKKKAELFCYLHDGKARYSRPLLACGSFASRSRKGRLEYFLVTTYNFVCDNQGRRGVMSMNSISWGFHTSQMLRELGDAIIVPAVLLTALVAGSIFLVTDYWCDAGTPSQDFFKGGVAAPLEVRRPSLLARYY